MASRLLISTDGWPFAKTVIAYDLVDSTNDRAAQLTRHGNQELPVVVWARRQTRGRGRHSHSWWSDDGSLTFTVALDPTAHGVTGDYEPSLGLAMAVAVIDALDELVLGGRLVGIRWPNDLEVDGRKLGGILPERVESALGPRVLIGVGVNVSTNLTDAPEEIRTTATSVARIAGIGRIDGGSWGEHLLPRLLAMTLGRFQAVLHRLVESDPALVARWNRLDLLRGQWVRADVGTRIVAGWAQGIDARGALCLDTGGEQLFLSGGQVLRECAATKRADLAGARLGDRGHHPR